MESFVLVPLLLGTDIDPRPLGRCLQCSLLPLRILVEMLGVYRPHRGIGGKGEEESARAGVHGRVVKQLMRVWGLGFGVVGRGSGIERI
jgi:hypothetical protein